MRARLFFLVISVAQTGCTAIDLNGIKPRAQSGTSCAVHQTFTATASTNLLFSLPNGLVQNRASLLSVASGNGAPVPLVGFAQYAEVMSRAKETLPASLQNDEVVDAVMRVITKSTAEAHIAAAKAAGLIVTDTDVKAVDDYAVPSDLSQDQLKSFSIKMLNSALRPVAQSASISQDDGNENQALGTYFNDYYDGNYVDRFGSKIDKPKIGLSIPDNEITAALTVLLDYLADLVDPTPVFGDTPTATAATKFYPGAGGKPTALKAALASYAQIPANGCGVTIANIGELANFAQGAADSAGSVSGLVSQSFGGFEVGLGFLGKFSLGDNQLLANLVKTTASRIALRSTFAGAYAAFNNPKSPITAVLTAPDPHSPEMLLFK